MTPGPLNQVVAVKWHHYIMVMARARMLPNGIKSLRYESIGYDRSTRYPWTKQPMAADKDPSTQVCNLLAEEGLTPKDGNIEANERVFSIVMGPEHSGLVRTQEFGVTPTRYFPQSRSEAGGGSGSNFAQIVSLIEEFRSFRGEMREFTSFRDEMRQFMQ
ncbi:hypothetical protein IEQ34_021045 [Dendrobium chrysotoxum]|uniref:Uncharacterized protein n=1 Tax=Dendrobium chrysotoxum TaxID=161865 RepID=A0AAV7G3Q1_DENCH|nr:hypothetical protein IEQ34_021045 [Dendrobium chrysotoxum]